MWKIYALFLDTLGQFNEEKHHYKSIRHIETKYQKIIFFVSNDSYSVSFFMFITHFVVALSIYSGQGGAIVSLHPVVEHAIFSKFDKPDPF